MVIMILGFMQLYAVPSCKHTVWLCFIGFLIPHRPLDGLGNALKTFSFGN